MTENEQLVEIEEMARDMCTFSQISKCCECSEECFYKEYAKRLYAKSYRRVERGEWKRNKKELGVDRAEAECSICGREVVYQVIDGKWGFENFCPHCGADMRGGENENSV